MKVVLFGATGMIGSGMLLECIRDDRVESVLEVGRRPREVESLVQDRGSERAFEREIFETSAIHPLGRR